jgi:hypothetical protein
MGKFKEMDIEQQETQEDDMDFEEMWERHMIAGAAELCTREDYGYSKFLDELHKALNEARVNKP